MESLLQVVNTTHGTDKNGVPFKTVVFKGVKFLGNREIKTNVSGTRNLFPAHELEIDGKIVYFKGDIDYSTIMIGDYFDGHVFSCDTTSYEIEDRTATRWTGVVFGHENPLMVAAKNLRRCNAAPIDSETGEVINLFNHYETRPEREIPQMKIVSSNGIA